jgi:hypothetical protein
MGRLDEVSLEELYELKEEYGVEYHENYAYELLREAGLSLRTARPQHHEADPEEKAEFQETIKKTVRTKRENRRCRRSIHQARWNRPAALLVPNRFRSDDRDDNVLGVGDSALRCHRRR